MSLIAILLIAFGVSIDAAAVSVSGSLCPGKYSKRHCAFNAACFFGGFQFIMPLTGFFAAELLSGLVEKIDHFLAFFLLLFVGGKMIWEACQGENSEKNSCPLGEFFAPKNLFIPAVATSLDALAVGAGLAFANSTIWLPAAMMGIITGAVSFICVIIGKKLASSKPGAAKKLSITGGVIIILIGTKILLQDIGIIPLF